MREPSDEQLMQRYADGDMAAFEALYARYRGPLFRYLTRQVGDPAQVNDLYQGVWEKIIAARKRLRPGTPFRAWAFRIAHNHLVDHYRRLRPTTSLEQAGFVGVPAEQEGLLDEAQRSAALKAAIMDLPEEQRTTLLLQLEGGFSRVDIARITGVGDETVKSRLRYAIAKLKQVMNQ